MLVLILLTCSFGRRTRTGEGLSPKHRVQEHLTISLKDSILQFNVPFLHTRVERPADLLMLNSVDVL